jgi:hypothetical protein
MKRIILVLCTVVNGIFLQAQVKEVNLTLNPSYTSQVFFQFGSDNQITIPVSDWDVAFLRNSDYSFAIRVNDAKINVYEVSNTDSGWNSVDISNQSAWNELYNNETVWDEGAFDRGSATYGWGEYNMINHHVVGTVVFVLKYDDGTYRKFMIQDFFRGYTCKYSTWDGSAWGPDQTFQIPNTTGEGRSFNYYSLANNQLVGIIPPDAGWDLFFTKYYSFYNNTMMYKVTGALQNPNIKVAKKLEGDNSSVEDSDFMADINTIGDGWKTLSGFTYVIPDNKYYVKLPDNTIYKIRFTSFGGTATGNISFSYEDVTNNLGIVELSNQSSFGVYPNPVENKIATLIYEVKNSGSKEASVSIFTMSGQKVYEEKITGQSGFYSKEMNLSKLTSGVYILVFKAGEVKKVKKILLK